MLPPLAFGLIQPMPKSDFYTRDNANSGIRMPLLNLDGTLSSDYLTIAGIDSDGFVSANAEAMRSALVIAEIECDETKDKLLRAEKIKLVASLVIGWSFDEDATQEAAQQFFTDAPQIMEQVNSKAAQRNAFIKKK